MVRVEFNLAKRWTHGARTPPPPPAAAAAVAAAAAAAATATTTTAAAENHTAQLTLIGPRTCQRLDPASVGSPTESSLD